MFLISQGESEFTAEDVRSDIGLAADQHDELIRTGIALACVMNEGAVRSSWAVSVGAFDRMIKAYGEPAKVGGVYLYSAKLGHFRDMTWNANDEAVAKARKAAGRWAMRQSEIAQSLFEERNPDLVGNVINYAHFNAVYRAPVREGRT